MKRNLLYRIFLLWTMAWVIMLLVGCTAAWTTEAINIITLLGPAISSILGILAAFGYGLSPEVSATFQKWSADAIAGLQEVKALIEQYDAAEAAAKPGLLVEIQTALSVISSNLQAILPTLHVTDPHTQAQIEAVVNAVAAEIAALLNLIPALQGTVTSHEHLKALVSAVKGPKEFKKDFNSKAGFFGKSFEI
jgi:hypothetical protein